MKSDRVIPEKLYFKISEVASFVGVEPFVLRYWETEFREIRPVKSRTQQRLYRRKDIEIIQKIKTLLYEEGFTIEGARRKMQNHRGDDSREIFFFNQLKKGLEEVLEILEG